MIAEGAHPCPTCTRTFRSARALSAHRRSHVAKSVCVVCGAEVRRLADHWRRRHTDEQGTLLPVLEAMEEQRAQDALKIQDLRAQIERARF